MWCFHLLYIRFEKLMPSIHFSHNSIVPNKFLFLNRIHILRFWSSILSAKSFYMYLYTFIIPTLNSASKAFNYT